MANDIITHLNEEPVQGLTLDQAVDKMRGRVNAKIKLKIVRERPGQADRGVITRDIIHVRPVRSHLEGTDIGFIRVSQFSEQTTDDLKKAIADLTSQSGDKLRGLSSIAQRSRACCSIQRSPPPMPFSRTGDGQPAAAMHRRRSGSKRAPGRCHQGQAR